MCDSLGRNPLFYLSEKIHEDKEGGERGEEGGEGEGERGGDTASSLTLSVLLAHNANVFQKDIFGHFCIHYWAYLGYQNLIITAFSSIGSGGPVGADHSTTLGIGYQKTFDMMNGMDGNGLSPLHMASSSYNGNSCLSAFLSFNSVEVCVCFICVLCVCFVCALCVLCVLCVCVCALCGH